MTQGYIRTATYALLLALILISGCVEEKRNYTLNPDGSGKVKIATFYQPMTEFDDTDPLIQARRTAERILEDSDGIDTWKDVSYGVTDDGKMFFKGTAYFTDLNIINFGGNSFNGIVSPKLTPTESENEMRLTMASIDDANDDTENEQLDLTEEQIQTGIRKIRLNFNNEKRMAIAMLSGLTEQHVFHLPSRIEDSSNFTRIDDYTISIEHNGVTMLEALEEFIQDDELIREFVISGKHLMKDGPDRKVFNELLFGERAEIEVLFDSATDELFDYDAEAETAKTNFNEMAKAIGLYARNEPAVNDTPKPDIINDVTRQTEVGEVYISGVRLIHGSEEYGNRIFSKDDGYTLSVIIALPEKTISVRNIDITTAITDSGQDLLQIDGRKNNPMWPGLTEKKSAAKFDLELAIPEDSANGIKELSGTLDYFTTNGTKELDLGLIDFKSYTKTQQDGFSINKIGPSEWDWDKGKTIVELNIDLLPGSLKETKFFDENGTEIACQLNRTTTSNGWLVKVDYKFEKALPEKGRIVMTVYDNMKRHQLNFKLSDVTLLGRPVK